MSEALALVDLLVLVHAERFAGWFMSSFSWVVQASYEAVQLCVVGKKPTRPFVQSVCQCSLSPIGPLFADYSLTQRCLPL